MKILLLILVIIGLVVSSPCLSENCNSESSACHRDSTCRKALADCANEYVSNLSFKKGEANRSRTAYNMCLSYTKINKLSTLVSCKNSKCPNDNVIA